MLANDVITQTPLLIRSFQVHDDSITSLGTCIQNDSLFILSSSTDCSIVLSDISGVPFGIFGQVDMLLVYWVFSSSLFRIFYFILIGLFLPLSHQRAHYQHFRMNCCQGFLQRYFPGGRHRMSKLICGVPCCPPSLPFLPCCKYIMRQLIGSLAHLPFKYAEGNI